MSSVGNLKDESQKRRERILALKNKRKGEDHESNSDKRSDLAGEKLPKPVFRSYKPQHDSLKEVQLEKVKPADVSEHVQEQLEASKPQPVVDEIDLVNLAPRKPDWDLKRDAAKKLEKLERRTQRAIAELIRDRLQQEDLVTAVNVNMQASQVDDDDD